MIDRIKLFLAFIAFCWTLLLDELFSNEEDDDERFWHEEE